MADRNPYAELKAAREQLAAAKKRADDAEMMLYDRYMVAAVQGLCARPTDFYHQKRELLPGADDYGRGSTPVTTQEIVAIAERITFACLRARALYKKGLSPNEPPKAQQPAKK